MTSTNMLISYRETES